MNRFLAALLLPILLLSARTVFAQRQEAYIPGPRPAAPGEMDDLRSFLIYKDHAYLIGKPILVSGPTVNSPSWSPTGAYLAYDQTLSEPNVLNIQSAVQNQTPIVPDHALCVYSVAQGKSVQVLQFQHAIQVQDQLSWIGATDKALVSVTTTTLDTTQPEPSVSQETKLYFMDAGTASMTEFAPWQGEDKPVEFAVMESPTLPYAFVQCTLEHNGFTPEGKPKKTLSTQLVLTSASGVVNAVHVPSNPEHVTPVWSEDGTQALLLAREKDGDKSKAVWYAMSLTTGEMKETSRPSGFYMGGKLVGLIGVRDVNQTTTDGKATLPLNALWLETTDPDSQNRLLLAGSASDGEVNKTMDCASFISQGSLFVRPISEVPKTRYDKAVVAWKRYQILNQAREAGLAVIMYAADYNDVLPGSRQNLASLVGPYLQDASLLSGFVYTFPGGPMTDILNPASTQLGYIDTPDGRAVVYTDGHVGWVPNKG